MTKLWMLPLEPISMRYGEQWLKWFEERLISRNIDYGIVKGVDLHNQNFIRTGQFLDAHVTNYWKLTQMASVVALLENGTIKHGDKIFDFDLWHTGLEAIPYITNLTKQNIEIYGIWHAGTYDVTDYLAKEGLGKWAANYEQSIMNFVKMGFVGSGYHADIITRSRSCNVKITGLPLNQADIIGNRDITKKENIIVFTSRLSEDKNIHYYKYIKDQILKNPKYRHVRFVETHKEKLSKDEYYDLLAKSKIVLSTAEHENFGIGVIEGMTLGCTPIVPNGLSYYEYVPDDNRFDTVEQAVDLITHVLDNYSHIAQTGSYVSKFNYSIDAMLDSMGYAGDYV